MKVLLLGGTGSVGRATARALTDAGHQVAALVRPSAETAVLDGFSLIRGEATKSKDVENVVRSNGFDAIVSCLGSRTGLRQDAWDVDYQANANALNAATAHGVGHFVMVSAISVQRPVLPTHIAKRAVEKELQDSKLNWSIVRPTVYFKTLADQIDRLRAGKPFVLYGSGVDVQLKPISERDTARFVAECLTEPGYRNRILPIGGPGPVTTPRAEADRLFKAFDLPPRFRHASVGRLALKAKLLSGPGRIAPSLAKASELAQIEHYRATNSMLVWDAKARRYDADATPEVGEETASDYFARLAGKDPSSTAVSYQIGEANDPA